MAGRMGWRCIGWAAVAFVVGCGQGAIGGGADGGGTGDGGSGPTPPPPPGPDPEPEPAILLPVEVAGFETPTETVSFELEGAAAADTLYLQCHRCAYRDASVNPDRGAKVSVRLNDGDWIDISNDTVEAYPLEASFGGLDGAFHTVRMTLPIDTAVEGANTLSFRMNGTDGYTSGFRILAFNIRANTTELIPTSAFAEEDVTAWAPISTDAEHLAAGEALWRGSKPLRESPLNEAPLSASCAGCHAQDGRDLKYFNFSNASIVSRSEFHGLSREEGEQVASYIRSLNVAVPENGRPWNPPYQPGPGLDALPVASWSAGAGLEWVLEDDLETLDHLFPSGRDAAALADVFDVDGTLNMRELPLALQLPDWNAWLPEIHPRDNWPEGFDTSVVGGDTLVALYEQLRALLETPSAEGGLDAVIADGRLKQALNRFAASSSHIGPMAGAIDASGRVVRRTDGNGINRSIVHWSAVKQWELHQEFALEGKADREGLYGDRWGESRSWVSLRRNVFEMAPHRLAENLSHFDHQTILVGKYFSTAWYNLQVIINAGAREGYNLGPTDWNYQPNHIVGLHRHGGPRQPIRYVASHVKMYQYMTNGITPGAKGGTFGLRQANINRYLPFVAPIFEDLDPALRGDLFGGLISMFAQSAASYDLVAWQATEMVDNLLLRGAPDGLPEPIEPHRFNAECHEGKYLSCFFGAIPHFADAGVDPAILNDAIDWAEVAWPDADWASIRP
ncbi:MAG: hypothetical protein AAGN82_19110 [Myxococcota bacterium]